MKWNKGAGKGLARKLVLCFGTIVIVLACVIRFTIVNNQSTGTITASSLLTETLGIAELSTAEFKYRGIAEIYEDDARTQIKCRVCYNAVVKAGIDTNKIQLDVDQDSKIISVILPEIDINVTIVDEQSMALLPSGSDVGIDILLRCSREDAENEAKQSEELLSTARENLQATIEGILYPIAKVQGYSIVCR